MSILSSVIFNIFVLLSVYSHNVSWLQIIGRGWLLIERDGETAMKLRLHLINRRTGNQCSPKFDERKERRKSGEKNWLNFRAIVHIVHSHIVLSNTIHPSLVFVTPPKDDGVGPSPRHCPSIQPFPLPSSFTLSRHGTRARFSMVHLAILYGPGIPPVRSPWASSVPTTIPRCSWANHSIETTIQTRSSSRWSIDLWGRGRKENVISRPIQPPTPSTHALDEEEVEEAGGSPRLRESLENIVLPAGRPSVGCRSPVITVIGF